MMKKEKVIDLDICVLGSGSSGNSIYISAGQTKILIDLGFSLRETTKRLEKLGVCLSDIQAVLITHEHSDHCQGLEGINKNFSCPVYLNKSTYSSVKAQMKNEESVAEFVNGDFFNIGDFLIKPFSVFHDASDPCGFSFFYQNKKITLATDLGCITQLVLQNLADSNIIMIESNYDHKMLVGGKYPWHLKNRILGREGHLSNHDAARAIKSVVHSDLEYVFLVHLSQENNEPQIAENTMKRCIPKNLRSKVFSASQDKPSRLFSSAEE